MARRFLDLFGAGSALIMTSPLLLVAAIGIWLTSPGPILYRAQRIGRDRRRRRPDRGPGDDVPERRQKTGYLGREFTMYKFRTMHVSASGATAPITARNDPRVFRFGRWLRAAKIDELPQLVNVMRGDMALVGPRPEDPEIVRNHYSEDDLGTLQVLPGLTSPGTLYYYTHGETRLSSDAVVALYVEQLLPTKLALDRVYLRQATLQYDLRIILRTLVVIVARSFGGRRFSDPPELAAAGVIGSTVSRTDLKSTSSSC